MPRRDIIVMGASAGGIGVLQKILPTLPWDMQVSIFIVVHTSEENPGLLPEVLNRSSQLPVLYGVHNAPILPARVYVAPGGQRHMLLDRDRLRLEPGPRENRNRPSIDALFRSASHAYGPRVTGIVVSGNLDDGAAGLADIKRRGGLAIVQDPEEATAPSMPNAARETTSVDFVLTAEEIGPKLIELTAAELPDKIQLVANENQNLEATGQVYSCPECSGVLQEVREGEVVRFRCRVGHLYSPESLIADQGIATERALWAAIRSLEEQSEFSERLANSSREKQHSRLARRFSDRAKSSREDASVLRALLEKTAEEVLEVTLEQTGTER
jgi:two-component system, chemotaxis family, protein-glutamate methylesterase/glutaminase